MEKYKPIDFGQMTIVPLLLIIYGGFMLANKSNTFGDIIGVIALVVGIGGVVLGFILSKLLHEPGVWWKNMLSGLIGTILSIVLLLIYVRMN